VEYYTEKIILRQIKMKCYEMFISLRSIFRSGDQGTKETTGMRASNFGKFHILTTGTGGS
jgi:hypothetical protein